ncbi:unnamed protein product [Penicillium salamii]|nr:unnamed protein product [Penicillium salamii]CAG8153649.1 unnamed protein product [Penicillium salamii]CAG8401972.1 unnamed protein product [Penicillium salamii]
MSKEYTTALHPPGPTPLSLTSPTNPPILNDALQIRLQVFVHEQNCSAATEIDTDDSRSWHWVLYSGTTAVGTIRLVPPHQQKGEGEAHEPCIKLTRVAIMPEYRGLGLGRRLVETALGWAVGIGREILVENGWRGLVLVHAQVGVEGMYGRLGFVVDEGLGRWDEEGIEHCGMFRRVGLD